MNILIVVRGKYPTPEASSKRLANYVKALQLEGVSVSILPIFINYKYSYQDLFFSFFVPMIAFWKVSKKAGDTSAVFIYGFGWVGKLSIILASNRRNKPVSVEVNEKPYSIDGNSRRDLFMNHTKPFHLFFLTKIVYPRINGFLVISDPLAKYINSHKKPSSIICKVPILVDFDFYQRPVDKPDCLSPYILNSARVNDHKDGILNTIIAFAKVVNEMEKNLYFYLTSNVALPELKDRISSILIDNKLIDRVRFLGDLDEETLLAYQAHSCMVVLNKVDSEQNRYNFATKLGEYLALGKPVITTQIGEVSNYLKDNFSCLYVDPSNPDNIAAAMVRLLNYPVSSERIGAEGKKIAKIEFDFRVHSKTITQFFSDQIKEK